MKKVAIIFFIFYIEKFFGLKILLKRKYPNVENGVYQLDNRGRPIKIVDVNYKHIWEIPKSGVNTYAVVKKNGEVKKFSEGTNILYGTTKRIKKENVDEIDEENIKKNIIKNKKIKNIKNVSDISKKEKEDIEKKRKKNPLPLPMHITAEDIPSEGKEKEDEKEINIGKELGVTIKENLEKHYEETKNPSPLSTDLLDIKISDSLEKLLIEDLEERKWISKKPATDNICLRDYSKQCPSAWERISNTQCISPKDYSGPCSHIMAFEPMTAKEKSELAKDCKVNWLCINESCGNNDRNYSKDCPENWIYKGKCEAPEDYSGGCNRIMDFSVFTKDEKKDFSSACKVVWPCKEESCERDYSITCPKGWSYNARKDICRGNKEFEGLISKEEMEAISHMSYHQRIVFSSKYGIAWPCKNNCTYGYDMYPCPRGWINLMNSGACKAPDDYDPPLHCPRITHFDYMNINEKEKFSKQCNVKWLCVENTLRDYSKCPLHFDYINEGNNKGMCQPNEKYMGPCKEVQDILSLKLEQKYNFEETCEAQFNQIQKEDIPQVEQVNISESTIEKLLKGTDSSKNGITLE